MLKSQCADLAAYMKYLQDSYGVSLCIKDYAGFVSIDKRMTEALLPYLGHSNPYCLYIKHTLEGHRHCLTMMTKIIRQCHYEDDIFYGTCYAGVREIVVPIYGDNHLLLGVILAGFLPVPPHEAAARISRALTKKPATALTKAKQLYERNIASMAGDKDELIPALRLLASYLSMTYHLSHESVDITQLMLSRRVEGSDEVYRNAITFIHENFLSQITVSLVAEACYCSESYVCHIIKKRLGVSLITYVNKLRIERAKTMLLETDKSILYVGMQSGFQDPNYFARVFLRLASMSPSEFRRRYR